MASNVGPENIVTDGLVLYLDAANHLSYVSGSGGWFDMSPNKSIGTLVNGPAFDFGNGGGIVFDGSNDVAKTDTNIITTLSNFTVEIGIKYSTSNPIYGGLFGYGKSPDADSNFGFMLHAQTNGFYALLSDGDSKTFGAGVSTLQNNTNYVLTFVFNSDGNTKSYINGSLILTGAPGVGFSSIKVDSSFYITIGMDVRYSIGDTSRHFLGNVYFCRVYNKELTASEIFQNYNELKPRFGL